MTLNEHWRALRQNRIAKLVLMVTGCLLLLITPLIGILPGPGGVVSFALGLGLVLQTSAWARRQYVLLKRKSPKIGGWADWGLRRQSAKRRSERAKLNDEKR
jgi:hypothetical protein